VFFSLALPLLPLALLSVLLLPFFFKIPFTMACLRTRAEYRAARRAISRPVRPVARRARSVSSSPPRPAAQRARNVSSAPAMTLGAEKSPPASGCKAESAPTDSPGPKSAPASPRASASGPTFLGHRLCLAAPSSRSRPWGTTVFSIKTVQKCVLAAGP
jgi:hypothetical protein